MPRTKPKPPPHSEPPSLKVNGPVSDVLNLSEAAAYLRLPETEVISLVSSQGLPGRLIGADWRFLKSAIQQWLSTSLPTPETRKAAQLAIVGKWKDDPDLEAMVEEIYRQRGRPITEDGSYKLFHGLSPDGEPK